MPADPTLAALEAAVRAAPDDLAAWSALADYLCELGDPRGEFARVQLALEDPAADRDARRRLRKAEDDLLDAYGLDFLGPKLARGLLGRDTTGLSRQNELVFRRGVLVAARDVRLTARAVAALATAPTAAFLAELAVNRIDAGVSVAPLARGPFVRRLTTLAVRGADRPVPAAPGVDDLVAAAANLAAVELWAADLDTRAVFAAPLPTVRELTVAAARFDLARLADNPTVGRLEALSLRWYPGDHGADTVTPAQVAAVGRSPHLRALARLRFDATFPGDAGCRALADAPLLRRLDALDLTAGFVTDDGLARLADALSRGPHRLRRLELNGNDVSVGPHTPAARLEALGVEVAVGGLDAAEHRRRFDPDAFDG